MTLVAQVLRHAQPDLKLNIGALGNVVRQLHLHVLLRQEGDPAWPGPVWGHSPREPHTAEAGHAAAERWRVPARGGDTGMTLEDRIADLEMRQAFQDDTIQTLNDIIVEQQRALDRCAAQIRVLAERQAELQSSGGGGLPDERRHRTIEIRSAAESCCRPDVRA